MNLWIIKSNQKILLLATLCTAAVLWGCKGDDLVQPVDTKVVADFTFTKGTAGAVTFKNASKNATSYAWDFGDGEKATEENPTHTYAKNDTYIVKLIATNAGGSADKTATVTIDNTVTTAPITIDIADLTQLVLPKNSPSGVVIGKLAATVANTDETPVYSITSQNPAGVLGLDGNKMMLVDTSAVDYATNTELTGEIQATAGSATATATFTISITDGAGIYIPDAKFKAVLLKNTALNTDGDQEISVAEAQAYTGTISGNKQGITDATGIEYFTKVTKLALSENYLTDIDVSNNTALDELNLFANKLTAIDVSKNTALSILDLYRNKLTDIDVSQNTILSNLNLSGNLFTSIDVSNNTELTVFLISNNNLTDIDVSSAIYLLWVDLSGNQLTAIDVSQNNITLNRLFLNNNALTKVNLANGQTNAITVLDLTDNPNLTCVQVDDPTNIPSAWDGKYDKDKVTFQTDACP